jgi:predicted RNase H-like HicB family nuclease
MDRIKQLIREVLSTPPKKESCNCGCHSCENVGNKGPVLNESLNAKIIMTENMKYHVDNKLPLTENTFRYGSQAFLDLWAEARYLYSRNAIHVNDDDKEILLETNLGEYGMYEGQRVSLDLLMLEESQMLDGYEVDFFHTKANVYANIEISSENSTFDDDIQIKGTGKTEEEAFEDLKQNYEKHKKGLYEVDKKNTHKITLTFNDERLIKRIQTIPTFQKMLAPNQIKSLKLGDNELVVNNVALNGLERMESMGLYKLKKDINEAEKKKNPPIGKPKRGGSKKFYVYVRDKGKIKKVSFGDTTGLSAKINNPEARRAFAARHDCKNKKDKTKASYWSCRLPRYAKLLGLKSSFSGFW